MNWQVLIMFAVAALLCLVGLGLLLALARPSGPAKVYVFRMAGIMALAAGVVLAFSASAMSQWERATMSGFMLGTATVLALAGILMSVAPQQMASRLSLAALPNDPGSRRIYRIGGGILIALAAALIIQLFAE